MKILNFGKFSGLRINGKIPMEVGSRFENDHFSRASWLTAEVESGGMFGTVISYDGTGITAGIHQAIAVFPKALDDNNKENDQGPLWDLLMMLSEYWPSVNSNLITATERSWPSFSSFLHANGIKVEDSRAKDPKTNKILSGLELRDILVGSPDGVFPLDFGKKRERAERIIVDFHKLFSSKWTFEIQERFGIEHFNKHETRRLSFCKNKKYFVLPLCEFLNRIPLITGSDFRKLSFEEYCLDLAMCVYLSNSVNAPSYAFKVLCKVIDSIDISNYYYFSKALISALGNTSFGRWDDDLKDGRYQRTRIVAKLKWPAELFDGKQAIMPKDLVG